VALRYRLELIAALGASDLKMDDAENGKLFETSRIRQALAPSLQLNVEGLRKLCVEADGSLRREALRTLAQLAVRPVVGDLAAARAGMESDDLWTRVEAARSYLLFAARATE